MAHLKTEKPDHPVLYFAPSVLQQTVRDFTTGFPGLVTYAVKANDARAVIENMIAAGVTAFDVASPAEIRKLRAISPNLTLHYNNPVRSPGEIREAMAAGVTSYSLDDPNELAKLVEVVPPEGVEVAVRLHLPIAGGIYDFGEKFGANPDEAVELLQAVAKSGYIPAMTFHPGTQCADPAVWPVYIDACANVAKRAGVRIERLNVGGGFAAHRGESPDLQAVFAAIKTSVARDFGADAPTLVCEPGRALVTEAFILATQVKAVRDTGSVFLNDGIYGSFGEALTSLGVVERISTCGHDGQPLKGALGPRVVYGPTCDSLDRLPGEIVLPDDLAVGDYVVFEGMGAYSTATITRFNGYGATRIITVQSGEL